uniref:Pinin/SDK/MemA protein domain-containing protein n=1 Tax=Panagrolaimus sp. ES5 TaxID=591445 RepID=A0AC34GN60_9BILA
MADISSQLNQKYDELRNIGHELATLSGREPKFPRKRANTTDEDAPPARRDNDRRISYETNDRKISHEASDRKVISYEPVERKRSRLIEDEPVRRSDRHEDPPSRRPTLQSTVRMPTIETKSREEVLAERKSQTKADGARNRRMFGNLLLGTLKQFQKEEKAPDVAPKTQAQHDKLKEVEERLEKSVRQDKEKFLQDKKAVEMKLREKEMEIKRLKQRQAIQAKNESKIVHYKRLQNFIQTETKPPIFFLPARLTLRGMELLKQTSRNMETLIKERQTEMETELRELEELSDGEIGPSVRSLVRVVSHDKDARAHLKPMNADGNMDEPMDDEDDDDDDLDDVFKIRSSVVVVKPEVKNGNSEVKPKEDEKVIVEKKESDGESKSKNDKNESKLDKSDSKSKSDKEDSKPKREYDSSVDNKRSKSNGDKEHSKSDKDDSKSKRDKDDSRSKSDKDDSRSKRDKDDSRSKNDKDDSKSKSDKEESKPKGDVEGKKVSSKKHGSASPSD